MERTEVDTEVEGLPRGHLGKFVATLTPSQRRLWRPIRKLMKQTNLAAAAADLARSSGSPREQLHDAIDEAQGRVTAQQIEDLIDAAVEKGDIGALRTLAQLGGVDLTERKQVEAGPGARVVIIRPKPLISLTVEQEATVRAEINAGSSGPVVL